MHSHCALLTENSPIETADACPQSEFALRLTAYLPTVVRFHLERHDDSDPVPCIQHANVVAMFADVSGFTALTESLAARGPVGAEVLGKHLNSYFEQMLRLISSAGGDVFKFAGDAMLIFWHENKEDTLPNIIRRCLQCALRIQSHLHEAELAPGVVLSVKMGVGFGNATIAHLGGVSDGCTARMEYIALGPALEQAFHAEHAATAGDVICTSECYARIANFFISEKVLVQSENNISGKSKHCEMPEIAEQEILYKIRKVQVPIRNHSRRASFTRDDPKLYSRMKQYVSRAVWPYINAHDEFWGSELRDVTVLFINLGFSEQDLAQVMDFKGIQRLQDAFALVQEAIFAYEGTINKFLVDDKGSTVIAAFGLPPLTHENDPVRGILSSLAICASLGSIELKASVGITSGVALCGVVGHQGNRREYTVLGDIVNLSARLMQRAKLERGGVITDEATKLLAQDVLHFEERPEIMVKGKHESIKIHRPYPRMSILMEYHLQSSVSLVSQKKIPMINNFKSILGSSNKEAEKKTTLMANVMQSMHCVQVRDAKRRLSLYESSKHPEIVTSECFEQLSNTILDRCANSSVQGSNGGIIVQGDIGVGKTVLARNVLGQLEKRNFRAFFASADPFSVHKPLNIWADIISKCVHLTENETEAALFEGVAPDLQHTELLNVSEGSISTKSRRRSARSVLASACTNPAFQPTQWKGKEEEKQKKYEIASFLRSLMQNHPNLFQNLSQHAHLLNVIFDTSVSEAGADIAEAQDTRPQDQREKADANQLAFWLDETLKACESDTFCKNEQWRRNTQVLGRIILSILHVLSSDRFTVYCLDNAMYLDPLSWIIALTIINNFKNCILILVTRRPWNALNDCTPDFNYRNIFSRVCQSSKCIELCLSPLGIPQTELLIKRILGVQSIPTALNSILVTRSKGNPLFLHEIIKNLLQQQVIIVDKNRQSCSLHLQEAWDDKSRTSTCFHCHLKLSLSKDKQRCKCCGFVFCPSCTPKACQRKLLGSTGDLVRHCRTCYTLTSTRRSSSTSEAPLHQSFNGTSGRNQKPKSKMRAILGRSVSHEAVGSKSQDQASRRVRDKSKQDNNTSSTGDRKQLLSAHSLSISDTRVAMQPPHRIKLILASLLDQLTLSQRMIMKTASMIGIAFEKELLRDACPIKAQYSCFNEDLIALETLNLIRRVESFIGGVPRHAALTVTPKDPVNAQAWNQNEQITEAHKARSADKIKVKYEFTQGFIQEVIQSQILCSQLDKLASRVADVRETQQKELRHRFFEKAKGKLGGASSARKNCDIFSTPSNNQKADRKDSFGESSDQNMDERSVGADTTCNTLLDEEEEEAEIPQNILQSRDKVKVAKAFAGSSFFPSKFQEDNCLHLKSGYVYVRKQSSLLSRIKWKGLGNARLWKKRFAVLQSSKLILFHDKSDTYPKTRKLSSPSPLAKKFIASPSMPSTVSPPVYPSSGLSDCATQSKKPRHCRLLYLQQAKVIYCDPDVASKVNCFQLQVNNWTKGKIAIKQRRAFIMGVQNESELEGWLYMIKYAIESSDE